MINKIYQLFIVLFFGLFFSYFLPFEITNKGEFIMKETTRLGDPLMVILVIALLSLFFSTVSKKDIENNGRIQFDKLRDVPMNFIKGVLEVIFSIIFFLIVPTYVSFFCYGVFNVGVAFSMFIGVAVLYAMVSLAKKYYWHN